MNLIFRDDDANVYTNAYQFKKLQEQFNAEGKVHTAAILMKDLWQNHALFHYLATTPNLEIGLHGWEHKDYSVLSYEECYEDLKKSLEYWKTNSTRMTGMCKDIKVFYAPWNRKGDNIERTCRDLGLKFCNVKNGEWEGNEVKSFHWWNIMNVGDKYTIDEILDK